MGKNNKTRQWVVSLGILAVCSGLAFGFSNWSKPPKKEQEADPLPLVESKVISPESVSFTISSQGVVRPSTETALVVEVAGVVTEVSSLFVSGGLFKKGDVLARIDDSDYQVALQQAEASLAASEARLQEEEARSEAEKKSWLRSGKKLSDAPALLLRTPFVNEAKANVKASRAQLEKARRDLAKTVIRAPYDGMVRERSLNIGQYLSPGGKAGAVFAVADVEIRLPLKPADLALIDLPSAGHNIDSDIQVQVGQVIGSEEIFWQARLARVEGVVDEHSRMHYVVAKVEDPYGLKQATQSMPLKIGSFVSARVSGGHVDGLYSVPRSALYGSGKVLVITEAGGVSFRDVVTVYADEEKVYLSSGLKTGDRICLTPLSNPVEGMRVRFRESAELTRLDATSEKSTES